MEPHEKDYITKIAPELNQLITLNTTILARLRSNDILSEEDLAELKGITNEIEKKYRFLEILKTKPNGYKLLKEALGEVIQNGAVDLLDRIPSEVPTNQGGQTNSTVTSKSLTPVCQHSTQKIGLRNQTYNLNFGEH